MNKLEEICKLKVPAGVKKSPLSKHHGAITQKSVSDLKTYILDDGRKI